VNQLEAEQSIGSPITNETDLARAGRTLLERLGSRHILITLGGRGLALFSNDGAWRRVPAVEVPVYDVAGAGDTVISAFTLALCAGADPGTAAELANLAAGAVVRKVGVATATPEEILALHHGA
jgi:bifunctional ADP-heptose synthase (sugar kinase/adenylyltransferase)